MLFQKAKTGTIYRGYIETKFGSIQNNVGTLDF